MKHKKHKFDTGSFILDIFFELFLVYIPRLFIRLFRLVFD